MSPVAALDPSSVRLGRARGRYFRENFAQGGVDLVQIIPELVTNADAAIAASGRASGRIVLSVGAPDPEFLAVWRARMRSLRSPALLSWKHELRCTDDGEGVDAGLIDARLGGARGRAAASWAAGPVWPRPPRCVAGAGRRTDRGRARRAWWSSRGSFPAPGDEPYAFVHVRDSGSDARPEGARGGRVRHPGDGAAGRGAAAGAGQAARAGLPAGAAAAGPRGPVPRGLPRAARSDAAADHLPGAGARPRAARAVRRRGPGRSERDGEDRRAPRQGAAVAGVLARDAPRRAGDPLRARRA